MTDLERELTETLLDAVNQACQVDYRDGVCIGAPRIRQALGQAPVGADLTKRRGHSPGRRAGCEYFGMRLMMWAGSRRGASPNRQKFFDSCQNNPLTTCNRRDRMAVWKPQYE